MNQSRSAIRQVTGIALFPGQTWGALAVLFVLMVLTIASVSHAEVVISEVLADPHRDWDGDGIVSYKADEWVEVLNNGNETVNLNVYWLRDESAYDPDVRLWGILEPGEVAVFYGSEVEAWQEENGLYGVGFALNNDGDQVFLLHEYPGQTWDEFEIVDSVVIQNHVADNDRTGGLSSDGTQWILYDYFMPYSGTTLPSGTSCMPSPGVRNQCPTSVPNTGATLDGIKAMYR